jgi:hypothetical protein
VALIGAAPALAQGLTEHVDGPDAGAGPLDLTRVAFGQDGGEMELELATAGDWDAAALADGSLCVALAAGGERGRVCVVAAGLRYSRLGADGTPVSGRAMSASVTRPNRRSLLATFDPAQAGLGVGRYAWQVVSSWGGVADVVPAASPVVTRIVDPPPPDQPPELGARADAGGDASTGVDLVSAALGQRGADLALALVARRPWDAGACVALRAGDLDAPPRALCVARRGGRPVLALDGRVIDANVHRPTRRSLWATFDPAAAGLAPGWFAWRVEAASDRVPDGGGVLDTIAPRPPRCFGAAARRRGRRCANPRLRLSVVPTPSDALIEPNAPCTVLPRSGLLLPCRFGVDPSVHTFALIGDSHAQHWRAAVDVLAEAKGWRGISLTHSSCPFTKAALGEMPKGQRARCVRWNREVLRWLGRHPAVTTVFVSDWDGYDRPRDVLVDGYLRAWRALPHTVERIVVLRDPPHAAPHARECVERAIARHVPAGPACAVPRSAVLLPDPAVAAAGKLRSLRVQVVDLTRTMCSLRLCLPVIGGALVLKDINHLTAVFARTLGPFLVRAVG